MKCERVSYVPKFFVPFQITITIESFDELAALTKVVGGMSLPGTYPLYTLLKEEKQRRS